MTVALLGVLSQPICTSTIIFAGFVADVLFNFQRMSGLFVWNQIIRSGNAKITNSQRSDTGYMYGKITLGMYNTLYLKVGLSGPCTRVFLYKPETDGTVTALLCSELKDTGSWLCAVRGATDFLRASVLTLKTNILYSHGLKKMHTHVLNVLHIWFQLQALVWKVLEMLWNDLVKEVGRTVFGRLSCPWLLLPLTLFSVYPDVSSHRPVLPPFCPIMDPDRVKLVMMD